MTRIRILERSGDIVPHSVVWSDPAEVPEVFIVVKDGATALAASDYIAGVLYDIAQGHLDPGEAWDFLLVKTPSMPHPQICRVRTIPGTNGAAEILVGNHTVHRIS